MNTQAYVGGDPVNLRDPSGMSSDGECVACGGPVITTAQGGGWLVGYLRWIWTANIDSSDVVPAAVGGRGAVGRSGNVPKFGDSHLHFEVVQGNKRVDPERELGCKKP